MSGLLGRYRRPAVHEVEDPDNCNQEGSPPQVWAPMVHSVDEPDQFTLICGQLGMLGGDRPTKVSHQSGALVEHGAEVRSWCVALNGERLVEVQQL
jgi:hypothetical protein